MADAHLHLPRDVQSDLHDSADRFGERVAKGELVDIRAVVSQNIDNFEDAEECTCKKYSKRVNSKTVIFWEEPDPDCKFVHFVPQVAKSYTVPL